MTKLQKFQVLLKLVRYGVVYLNSLEELDLTVEEYMNLRNNNESFNKAYEKAFQSYLKVYKMQQETKCGKLYGYQYKCECVICLRVKRILQNYIKEDNNGKNM